MNTKSKILVVGGAGYIGSHVTYELCDNDFDVYVLDDLSTGFEENIDLRSNFIRGSYSDQDLLSKILPEIDIVIHLAALKSVGDSMKNPIIYSQKNIIDSINLINSCINNKVDKFIFSSSAAVYGHPQNLPITEESSLNPINYYGFTKLSIEKHLVWMSKIYKMKIACLRYFNAAGYDVKKRITKKERDPANLLPLIMEVACGERKFLNVFGDDYDTPDGTCLRDYIHVNDLALAHLYAIKKLISINVLITNLATGSYHSVLQVINEVQLITKRKINYKIVNRRHGDPARLYASSNNILNLTNKFSDLRTIVKTMWDVYG